MTNSGDNPNSMDQTPLYELDHALGTLRRYRFVTIYSWSCATLMSCVVLLAIIDNVIHLDQWLRFLALLSIVLSLCTTLVAHAIHTRKRQDDLVALALHLEHKRHTLRGWLASATELRSRLDDNATQCVQEASQRLLKSGPITVSTRGPIIAGGTVTLLLTTLVVVLYVYPTTTSIALNRIILPFGKAIWPARTSVESNMPLDLVHGQGLPLRVQARNTTPNNATEPIDVVLQTTLIDGSMIQNREQLTHQNHDVHGGVLNLPLDATMTTLWFETEDANTPQQHIPIHPLPSIKSTQLTVKPPWTHASVLESKTTTTEHSFPKAHKPILSGSSIELLIEFDSHIRDPQTFDGTEMEWAKHNLGWTLPYLPGVKSTPTTWKLQWVLDTHCTLKLYMEDVHGLQALDRPQLQLSNIIDTTPQLVLVDPSVDLALPPTAILNLKGRVVDDYPLHTLSLRVDTMVGGANAFTESIEQPGNKSNIEATVALQSLSAKPGDIFEIRVEAEDLGDTTTGRRVVQGRARTVQVVSIERFLDNAHSALTTLGDVVRTMERRQTTLLHKSQAGAWTNTSNSTQRRLARDIRTASQNASDVLDTLTMGRVDAPDLRLLADEAVLSLQEAADLAMTITSSEASRHQNQIEVATALQTLANRLSGDREQWAARRMVRDLLERQRALQSALAELYNDNVSQGNQRATTLEGIQVAQNALANDTHKITTTLQGTPQDAIAQALLKENVEASMRTAEIEAHNNRIGLARAAQAKASSALERINNEITQSTSEQRTQVATLRRRLSDLQSLVARLLDHQGIALTEFDKTIFSDGTTEQLQRIHRGILSAVQRAARAGDTIYGIESTLREASTLQSSAILFLVQDPIDIPSAHADALFVESHLVHVLDLIEDASGDLMQLETQQFTTQLAHNIKAISEQQRSIRTETELQSGNTDSTRRKRFELRQLGVQQKSVVDAIGALSLVEETLQSSMMACTALRLAAEQAHEAATPLLEGALPSTVIVDQQQVEMKLNRLAAAITTSGTGPNTNESPFSHAQGNATYETGSPSDSTSAPSLPSVAELHILRGLQEDLLIRTQAAIHQADVSTFELIAQEQRELAQLGGALMEEVSRKRRPMAKQGAHSDAGIEQAPIIPMQLQSTPKIDIESDIPTALPSLDALLGLEDTGPMQTMPNVPVDALAAVSTRLMQAADALQEDSGLLAQRLQQDALVRIDALLNQANQQSQDNQSQSMSGVPMERAGEAANTGATQGQPTDGNTNIDAAGETGNRNTNAVDPQLGGAMEHRGAAWGTLPPRLRGMLEQGRRDDTSLLYADICAEYFRSLLEAPNQ